MKKHSNSRAFTLVELLMSASIALLIAIVISKIFITSVTITSETSSQALNIDKARVALRYISRDLMDAENIITPAAVGSPGNDLLIEGISVKDQAFTASNELKTIFRPTIALNRPWAQGKKVTVYFDGSSIDSGYYLDYTNKRITFEEPKPAQITADFSYDVDVNYRIVDGKLMRYAGKDENNDGVVSGASEESSSKTIADGLINDPAIFEKINANNYKINLTFSDYDFSTVLDISAGVYLEDISDQLPLADKPDLNDAYFVDPTMGWVVGEAGTIVRYTDDVWENMTSQNPQSPKQNLRAVYFDNSSTGWSVGDAGTILKFQSNAWNQQTSAGNLKDIFAKDTNSILAVGSQGADAATSSFSGSLPWKNTTLTGLKPFNNLAEYNSLRYAAANDGMIYRQIKNDGDYTLSSVKTIKEIYEQDLGNGNGSYNPDAGAMPHFNTLTIMSGGILTTPEGTRTPNGSQFITTNLVKIAFSAQTLDIQTGGKIDATGKGNVGGPGPPSNDYKNGTGPGGGGYAGAGAGYGGAGANRGCPSWWSIELCASKGKGGIAYGAYPDPITYGSGGAGHSAAGGNGGGFIDISAGNITLNGQIISNGIDGPNVWSWGVTGSGGGSGGGINIVSQNPISNAQNIEAKGGKGGNGNTSSGGDYAGGGGGGGRVNIYPSYSGTPVVTGGAGGVAAYSAGSGAAGVVSSNLYGSSSGEWLPVTGAPCGSDNLNGDAVLSKENIEGAFYVWVVGNNGQIVKVDSSTNSCAVKVNTNTQQSKHNLKAVSFFDQETGWAVGDAGTVLRYDLKLDQWFEVPIPTEVPEGESLPDLNGVFMTSREEGYIVGNNGTVLKIVNTKR